MATTKSARSTKRRSVRLPFIHKPRGKLNPRVEKVGPKHFGIVCVDCAKVRSKWMFCDFYGNILLPPVELIHTKAHFDSAICLLQGAIQGHRIKDLVVAIERTGNYHLPVKRAFGKAGFDCRIVHPFATKQFRQPADPGNKTDDTDLAGMYRATVNGFGLIEAPLDPLAEQLRLLVRHRRDLVSKRSAVYCQIREHLDAVLPGYARLFDKLWDSTTAMCIARHFISPEAIQQGGVNALTTTLKNSGHRTHAPTLQRIIAWSRTAPSPDTQAAVHHRVLLALDDDRIAKTLQIQALERDIAGVFVQTPYVLLLSWPGINVASAAELAGEMGPITHYANARAITGRAGLFPSRYQSDQVDCRNGSLIRCANRRLRAALMTVADNLVKCNNHFRALSDLWRLNNKDERRVRVDAASRFSRIAYHMVAGCQVCRHPGVRERSYILDKLLTFHREHDTDMSQIQADLQAATDQIPHAEYQAESAALIKLLQQTHTARTRRAQAVGEILPLVLAKLGASLLQCDSSGGQGPN